MGRMNAQMNIAAITQIMMEFEKQVPPNPLQALCSDLGRTRSWT